MTNTEIVEGLKKLRTVHNGNYAPHVDEAIKKLSAEPCEDCIKIPKGATNGDMIKAMFPKAYFHDMAITVHATTNVTSNGMRGGISYDFWKDWWNSPYRKEQEGR